MLSINCLGQNLILHSQISIGGTGDDKLMRSIGTGDGGVLLTGFSNSDSSGDKTENSKGLYDYWVVKLDSNLSIEFDKTYGGSDNDYLYGSIETLDGGYLLSGYSYSPVSGDKTDGNFGQEDYWVIKTDNLGNIEWQKTIGGSLVDRYRDVVQLPDSSYILVG